MTLPVTTNRPHTAPHAAYCVTRFTGASALSDFRARQLLPRLQAVEPRITSLTARFVHLVATDAALSDAQQAQFAALLNYGEPFAEPGAGHAAIVVAPRLGRVSPWALRTAAISVMSRQALTPSLSRTLAGSTQYPRASS